MYIDGTDCAIILQNRGLLGRNLLIPDFTKLPDCMATRGGQVLIL
ncbi:hypothetical protein OOU_Y34scaffold00719g7 [Pyricularia oryzae Y34]|uniref:Uncharacterized protein n=2 Tax=Pyricularia oryzae TaxID=318829 RepID=A0AA97PI07_PYRO3|nr:hypothetical protein OOU_Y34scaffold00719g7 [Pyricularia oryzae Y34]